jgi:hypothetical protein
MRSHPFAVHVLDNNDQHVADERIARDGIVLACPVRTKYRLGATACRDNAEDLADRFPPGKRTQVDVARRFLGVDGAPARYLIIAIPPRL